MITAIFTAFFALSLCAVICGIADISYRWRLIREESERRERIYAEKDKDATPVIYQSRRALVAMAVPIAVIAIAIVAAVLRPAIHPDPERRSFEALWQDRVAEPLAVGGVAPPTVQDGVLAPYDWWRADDATLAPAPTQRLPFPTPVKTIRVVP